MATKKLLELLDLLDTFRDLSGSPCWAVLIATMVEAKLSDTLSDIKIEIQYHEAKAEFGLPRASRSQIVVQIGDRKLTSELNHFDPEWLVSLIARGVRVVRENCMTHERRQEAVFRNALEASGIQLCWHAVQGAIPEPSKR